MQGINTASLLRAESTITTIRLSGIGRARNARQTTPCRTQSFNTTLARCTCTSYVLIVPSSAHIARPRASLGAASALGGRYMHRNPRPRTTTPDGRETHGVDYNLSIKKRDSCLNDSLHGLTNFKSSLWCVRHWQKHRNAFQPQRNDVPVVFRGYHRTVHPATFGEV